MMIERGIRYFKKAIHIGPYRTIRVLEQKIRTRIFRSYWRTRALQKRANHTWQALQEREGIEYSYNFFLASLKRKSPQFLAYFVPTYQKHVLDQADNWVQNSFSILGSRMHTYDVLPWHQDIRLKHEHPDLDSLFAEHMFYQDIVIEACQDPVRIGKDIKVPWELSRFQHLLILAHAYQITKNSVYAFTYMQHLNDWMQKNPYMLGVNWVCPMEVGLRSINWIISFFLLVQAPVVHDEFWERFICSLYDHMHYLEHNWEIYDGRTSNHYLSDLVGYLYVCYFFQDLPGVSNKAAWCFTEILHECTKQVFAEGTSYEGSTSYHYLVSELFIHAYLVAQELLLPIPLWFEQRIGRMLAFINWCSYDHHHYITVGDNDSGHVTYLGITHAMRSLWNVPEQKGFHHFQEFGISIIKKDPWHISLRSHAYQARQPSGHFHNDVGSITVAVNGVPLFIDPGSYLYTPSIAWRNYFRSASVHNGVYLEHEEPVPLTNNLFKLELDDSGNNVKMSAKDESCFFVEFPLKSGASLYCTRSIKLSDDAKIFSIRDEVVDDKSCYSMEKNMCWNFTLSPEINAVQINEHTWSLQHKSREIALFYSSHAVFVLESTWTSPDYGAKVPTFSLRGSRPLGQVLRCLVLFYIKLANE